MKLKSYSLFILTILFFNCQGQNKATQKKMTNQKANSQSINGRTYKALALSSCTETLKGGYMSDTYVILAFEKDTVFISTKTDDYGDLEHVKSHHKSLGSHTYRIVDSVLTINNLNNFLLSEKLKMTEDKLFASSKYNKKLVFSESKN